MRRNTSGPTTVWSADIPKAHLDHFEALFPMHGARTWLVQSGLEKFLAMAEARPGIVSWSRLMIDKMLNEEPTPTGLRQDVNMRVPTALYERFNKLLPMKGATTWFIRRLIKNTLEEGERSALNLEEFIERALVAFLQDEVPIQ